MVIGRTGRQGSVSRRRRRRAEMELYHRRRGKIESRDQRGQSAVRVERRCVCTVSDLSSGTIRWKYQTGGFVLARAVERDGVVYAGSYDGRMYGLDAEDGRPLGAFEAGGEIFSSPAVDDGEGILRHEPGRFCRASRAARP